MLLLGSCFSESIGYKFEYFKFQSSVNPFGILFHPLAIENLITRSINKDYYSEDEIVLHNEQWICLDAHSRLNSISKDDILSNINNALDQTNKRIRESTHIIITLGTAWVYRHVSSDKIVANCHKLPQKQFIKELLSTEEISHSLDAIISLIRSINPKVNFIFTVSPVRHLKDGFVENTRSKSHLLAAVHQVIESRKQQYYYPSYEILIDELRDYRFYNADMIHPNDIAINYIWNKFKTVWLTEEALKTSETVAAIQTKKAHRPFNPNSDSHKQFLTKLSEEVSELCTKFPHISF